MQKIFLFQGECMNWKRFFVAMFALLAVLSIGSNRLAAQTATTGDITGVVTDQTGAVVPDAKVTLKDNAKGNTQDATTNREGAYHFYLLTPSSYTVTVTATGFSTVSRTSPVGVGQIATLNLQLTIGASSTSVTVTEAAPLLQTDNGDTSSSVTAQQVSNVPNPGNDLSAIAQLAPGVIMNTMGGDGNVEAFGLPATSNLFTMDGMDDNDPFLNLNNSGATNLLLGSNEVQEADVVTNGFSAAYGTFAGINVNYVTKSGGNDFHGNAVYYWNGSALNAEPWLDKNAGIAKPFDNANQWAASLGGPIKKDKLFFFLNTEGLRVLIPVPSSFNVPTQPFEAAVVQNLTNLGLGASIPFYCQNLPGICPGVAAVPGSGAGMFNLFNGAKNQGSASSANLPLGCAFNNLGVCVPTGLGNGCANVANAGAFAGFAGPCAANLREDPINFAPEWQLAGRLDWNIGANDRAFLRVQYDVGTQPTFTDPLNPIFNASSHQPEYQGQLNETHTFSPSLTNQFLLSATWYSAIFQTTNESASLAAFPTSLILGDASLGDQVSGLGVGGENFAFPQGRNVTQFQIGDDVSKSIGAHTVKFGVKFHKNYVSDHDFGNRIIGLEIPFSLADFANGGDVAAPNSEGVELQQSFSALTNVPVTLYEFAGYVQDDWKVKSNLTISPGLRIEHASNPDCTIGCFSQFSGTLAEIGANPGAPYNTQIDSGRHQALNSYQGVQWSPRLSFAWQPFNNSRSMLTSNFVVRGGVGIFYDIFPGVVSDNLAQNAPLFNPFVISTSAACPGAFVSPNQTGNIFGCASGDNAAFVSAFNSGASTVATPPGFTFTDPRTEAPQFQKWNLQIQKGFGANDVLTIGYNGNHGIHLPVLNNGVNGFGFGNLPLTAPTSQFGVVDDIQSAGISNYNGMTLSYQHRFNAAGGGVFQFNYTFSKAMDEISNGGFLPFLGVGSVGFPQETGNLRNNYGPADYDARHVINANYVWQVPIRKMLMGHGWAPLVDGWQVSGAIFYRTGFPFTVEDVNEANNLAANNGTEGNIGGPLFPNVLAPVLGTSCNSEKFAGQNAVPCLALSNFTPQGTETGFGAQGLRNAFRGPSYFDTDFSFTKKTAIPHWERGQFQLGFQFFNLFNHPNFAAPVADISNGSFGTIQSAVSPPTSILGSFLGGDASPRLIQVKAQIVF
jgi:hypothetical protein